jgi:hypothetical protein
MLGTQIIRGLDQRFPKARFELRGVDHPVFRAHMIYEDRTKRCRVRFGIGIKGKRLFGILSRALVPSDSGS